MRETEPDSIRRSKLHDHLARIVPPEELARVSEFLGELLTIQAEKGGSAQLQAGAP